MVGPIMAAVGGTVPRGIIHIQVQKDGRLELGLYDNFAPKCMFFWARPGINVLCDIARCRNSGALDRTIMPAKCAISVSCRREGQAEQVTANPVSRELRVSVGPVTRPEWPRIDPLTKGRSADRHHK
jgi:hypothetical protein